MVVGKGQQAQARRNHTGAHDPFEFHPQNVGMDK